MTESNIIDYCKECEAKVHYNPIYVHEWTSDDGCQEEYTLGGCNVCGEPALFYREDVEFMINEIGMDDLAFHRLWPPAKRNLSFYVPEQVSISYEEAVEALNSNLLLASSVMIGRALEAACLDFDNSIQGIFQGLKKMKDSGALSEEMYEWANSLRVLRNQGAHPKKIDITKDEVEYGLDFLKAILEIIYDIRPKFERYTDYQANKKAR